MKVGALIFGILGGLIALLYGFLGYGLGSLATGLGGVGDGSMMKIISLGIPIGALVGAGIVMAKPVFGASLMAIAAVSLVLILGFNIFSLFPVVLLGLGALLGFSGAAQEDKKQSTNLDVDRIKSTKASSAYPTDRLVLPVAKFDQSRWNALLKYDNDIASIADKIRPFGQKWLDEFALSYFALNDKQYLPEIEHKITVAAIREKGEREQEALTAAKAEAERKEQLRIHTEQQKKAYEEQQKACLEEQERHSQARKEQIKVWQNLIIRNRKALAIGGVIVFFVGVILIVVLWQRSIKIEEEARLSEERNQERIAREQVEETARKEIERQRIAREQAEERARIAEETARKEIERQRTVDFNTQPLSVVIPASPIWIDTGVELPRGQAAISAAGAWTVWRGVWSPVGPEGHPQSDAIPASDAGRRSWPMPSAKNGALVGRIDEGKIFLIGSHRTIVVDSPGRLFLTINDAPSSGGDNSGNMKVTVTYELWPDRNPCAGYTDNSLASSVTLACLQKIWLDSGCTTTGTSYPRNTNSWWSNSPDGTKPVDCDATHTGAQCGAGNYRTIVNDMRAWATLPDGAHRAGCGRDGEPINPQLGNQLSMSSAKNASFDCSQAKTASEVAICNNVDLSRMDKELALLYQSRLKDYKNDPSIAKKLRGTQRSWLVERNRCGSNVSCLRVRYQEGIAWLREFEGYD